MTLGEKILSLRKARGWNQEELADRIGVSRQAVSRWESDSAKPDGDKIIAICREFGISADYLLGIDSTETPKASRPQLDRRMLSWMLLAAFLTLLLIYSLVWQLKEKNLIWMLWLGLGCLGWGLGLGPFYEHCRRRELRRELGIVLMVLAAAPGVILFFYVLGGEVLPETAASMLWLLAVLLASGGTLVYGSAE